MARRRRGFRLGIAVPAVLGPALLLTVACTVTPEAIKSSPPQNEAMIEVPFEPSPKLGEQPLAAAKRATDPPLAPEPAPEIARRVINDDPTQLMGLAPETVGRLLGPPSLLRYEPPAQVWQYQIGDCVLDIFLYPEEIDPNNTRVTYFEIRDGEVAVRGTRVCFAAILEMRVLESSATPRS